MPDNRHFIVSVWGYRGIMMMVRSEEVVTRLAQEYPREAVLERLKELYQAELYRVIEELGELLPRYRACVSRRLYGREKAELQRVKSHLSTKPSLQNLEASLKYLLKKQLYLTETLKQEAGSEPNQDFQLQCRVTGIVKAYKQMTSAQAERLNVFLAAEDSYCRWAPLSAAPPKTQTA